jgi:peroxiredoxin 2/4
LNNLPEIGDLAPSFEVETTRGRVSFPEYSAGKWCILFAHPANFTTAWQMFSVFLSKKERWLDERHTKVIGLTNVPFRQNDWTQKAQRYVGIYLRGPVIEDLDCHIAKMYGIASGRRPLPGCDRLALIIDPDGIIRLIIHRPLPNIEEALLEIERKLEQLQGYAPPDARMTGPDETSQNQPTPERSDAPDHDYTLKPAYFKRKNLPEN